MYRPNEQHRQLPLMSTLDELPEKLRERLDESWAGTFYRECFCRIQEAPFAVLYSEVSSRPNVPVNVLVGLETLKAGFGWSDEETIEAFSYDMQVRYALGYRDLRNGHFELRTLYNFRRRLSKHMQTTGENLLEHAFEDITDQQVEKLAIKTSMLRMDSTQIASNIREFSRLQLLVEVVQRVVRVMGESDRLRFEELLAPYLEGSSGHYIYRVKPAEQKRHVSQIGEVMAKLVDELAAGYSEQAAYRLLVRVFHEHFVLDTTGLRVKQGAELRGDTLQSPDDPDATYRFKQGQAYRGYAANLTETCDPTNPVQLILAVQVAPNVVDDGKLLADVLPRLVERTDIEELYVDGGYNGPPVDNLLRRHRVSLIPSAIRGGILSGDTLSLDQFDWQTDTAGWPQSITCPHGQAAPIQRGTQDHFQAHFDASVCAICPFLDYCPSQPRQRTPVHVLNIKKRSFFAALYRQRMNSIIASDVNLRASVEASVRSVKHPFPAGRLPVRGNIRVSMLLIGSALMTNIRRIARYQYDLNHPKLPVALSIFHRLLARFCLWLTAPPALYPAAA